jgi:spermidine/putrescine transport system substrate-binding protein
MSDQERSQIERTIERLMREDPMSRRTFLRRTGRGGLALGAALTLPSILAACAPAKSKLEWANWVLYIDRDDAGNSPTIDEFTKLTGIAVDYVEGAINDNEEFFGTIQPDLAAGNVLKWDIISPTSWMVRKMASLGYLEEIDHSKLPNWTANCADYARGLWFDPDNKYSVWWQGGITGIGYDPNLTGREITSFDDLLDPAFKGRVGGFSDMRDMMCLSLLSLGITPANATMADATRAQQKLLTAAQNGQFRGFYGNDYYDSLSNGDLVASVAWSGDVTQMQLYDNPNVKFIIPSGGAPRWNDNLCIPKKAVWKEQAHKLMDYWYDVVPATTLSEYIGYWTPTKGVPEAIRADAAAARAAGDTETADFDEIIADVVSPTSEQLANVYDYPELADPVEEKAWNDLFLAVTTANG